MSTSGATAAKARVGEVRAGDPRITLAQLRYFVRTAELGSMTAAAQELYVAQSAISAALTQLETTLGCTLLVRRRSRGVSLTDRGRVFRDGALAVLAALDDAVAAVAPDRLTGSLVAGCFTTLAPFWLPEVHERLRVAHPELEVRIREVTADEIEGVLARRELEAVLTYGFDYGREVAFDPLALAPLYAAVGEGHRFADLGEVSLSMLAQEPLVLLDMGKSTNYFLSVFRDAGLRPRIAQRFESVEVVRSMVARGHGYTLLNQAPGHGLTSEGLRLRRLAVRGGPGALHVGIARRSDGPLSRKGQEFAASCRDAVGTGPGSWAAPEPP